MMHPLAGLAVIVVGLGMIQVDLGHGRRGHVRCQECLSILDREPNVVQPPLVARAGSRSGSPREASRSRSGRDRAGPGRSRSCSGHCRSPGRSRPAPRGRRSPSSRADRMRVVASSPCAPTPARARSCRGSEHRIQARCLQEAPSARLPFEKSSPAGGTNVILL